MCQFIAKIRLCQTLPRYPDSFRPRSVAVSDCRSARPATSRRAASQYSQEACERLGKPTPAGPMPAGRHRRPRAAVAATVRLPGSKSITNRALILAALADTPTTIVGPLQARDTDLMAAAIIGAGRRPSTLTGRSRIGRAPAWTVTPGWRQRPGQGRRRQRRHRAPVRAAGRGALAAADVEFSGDPRAAQRPVGQLLAGLRQAGVEINDGGRGAVPFVVRGRGRVARRHGDAGRIVVLAAGLRADAGGAAVRAGLEIVHQGDRIPSAPHIAMTAAMLTSRGRRAWSRGLRRRRRQGDARRRTTGGSGPDGSRQARSPSSRICPMRPRSWPRPWSRADGSRSPAGQPTSLQAADQILDVLEPDGRQLAR